MVGFGSSLRMARRRGWEHAYLDYESLKLMLTQIEAVYEEEGHRRAHQHHAFDEYEFGVGMNATGSGGEGGGGNHRRRRGKGGGDKTTAAAGSGDYRDELFCESDSEAAFGLSSSGEEDDDYSDATADDEHDGADSIHSYEEEDRSSAGGSIGGGGAGAGGLGGGGNPAASDSVLPPDASFAYSHPFGGLSASTAATSADREGGAGHAHPTSFSGGRGGVAADAGERGHRHESTAGRGGFAVGGGASSFFPNNSLSGYDEDDDESSHGPQRFSSSAAGSPMQQFYFGGGHPKSTDLEEEPRTERTGLLTHQMHHLHDPAPAAGQKRRAEPYRGVNLYDFAAAPGTQEATRALEEEEKYYSASSPPGDNFIVNFFFGRRRQAAQQAHHRGPSDSASAVRRSLLSLGRTDADMDPQQNLGTRGAPRRAAARRTGRKKSSSGTGGARRKRRARMTRRRRRRQKRKPIPEYLRRAHHKASAITERFLGLLRAEVEKVSLFAHSRMGELADTIGSLRFPSYDDEGDGQYGRYHHGGTHDPFENTLSDGGIHPSSSSSDDERVGGGSMSWSASSSDGEEGGPAGGRIDSFGNTPRLSLRNAGSLNQQSATHSRDRKTGDRRKTERHRGYDDLAASTDAKDPVRRQILHSEHLRIARSLFQRGDFLGEDFLLLSAVDEADAYTAVAVELVHLLRFICVNIIAVRKICKKHDYLDSNRMLGGYYHRQRRMRRRAAASALRAKRRNARKRNSSAPKRSDNQPILGEILSNSVAEGDDDNDSKRNNKLVGVYDVKIQKLANSQTIQLISSSLSFALTEYEVSRSRADALSRPKTPPDKTPVRSGNPTRNNAFVVEHTAEPLHDISSPYQSFSASRLRQVVTTRLHSECLKVEAKDEESASALSHENDGGPPSTSSSVSSIRLQFAVASVFGLREAARMKHNLVEQFFSRAGMTFTGPNVVGCGLDCCSRQTLDFFVMYNPDSALLLETHLLHKCLQPERLQEVMMASLALASSDSSVLTSVRTDGRHDFEGLGIIAVSGALSVQPKCDSGDNVADQSHAEDRTPSSDADTVYQNTLRLNLFSSFLYSVNYYMITPTAHASTCFLGARPPHSATLIGAASVTSMLSTIFHAFLLSKNGTAMRRQVGSSFSWGPLVFAAAFPAIGNLVFAHAFEQRSFAMATGGRLLIGLGSAEVINRQVILSCVQESNLVFETSRLVKASMLGIPVGLAMGALLDVGDDIVLVFGQYVNTLVFPGYFMSFLWFVQLFGVLCFFNPQEVQEDKKLEALNEPVLKETDALLANEDDLVEDFNSETESESESVSGTTTGLDGIKANFGPPPSKNSQSTGDTEPADKAADVDKQHGHDEGSNSSRPELHQPPASHRRKRTVARFNRIRKLVFRSNIALPATISLFLFVRFTSEVLLSSSALITKRYFGWNGISTGLFLSGLAAFFIPINTVVTLQNKIERKTFKLALKLVGLGIVVMTNYEALVFLAYDIFTDQTSGGIQVKYYDGPFGLCQYLVGLSLIFASLIVLEGQTTSLMSKVAPAKLSAFSVDCGFIVSFIGAFGKFAGDMLIIFVGLSHRIINTDIVNSLSFFLLCACCAAYYIVKRHYFFLNSL